MLRRLSRLAAGLLVLAAHAAVASVCTWADPGHDPYVLGVPAAVDTYTDIPLSIRERLKLSMERRHYDDFVAITRLGVQGGYVNMRDMHFGTGRLCRGTVDTSGWPDHATERGLVYCVHQHCVIVPTVCRNVSRVDKLPPSGRVLDMPGGFADEVLWQPSGDGGNDQHTDTTEDVVTASRGSGGGDTGNTPWQWEETGETTPTAGEDGRGGSGGFWPTVYPPRSVLLPPLDTPFSVVLPRTGVVGGSIGAVSAYAAPIPETSTLSLLTVGLCAVLICGYVSRRRQS